MLTILWCTQDLPPLVEELLSKKKLDRGLLAAAIRSAIQEARISEQLALQRTLAMDRAEALASERLERDAREAAVSAERNAREAAVTAERAERGKRDKLIDDLTLAREALFYTSQALRQRNIDYLRIKGTVDIRSAMGE